MQTIADIYPIDNNYLKKIFVGNYFNGYAARVAALPQVINDTVSVGIEVEVENVPAPINDGTGAWMLKTDGSLRNNGVEYVSWPLRGNAIPTALLALFDQLPKDIHFSPRTSIHFHMDVMHLSVQQVSSIVLAYLAVEPLLYKFVGQDRDKNIYCVPMYTTGTVNDLVQFIAKKLGKNSLNGSRYLGLNLASIPKFGTLEFRHLGGTTDVAHILTWLNLLFKIYEYGCKQELGTVISTVCELNTNSYYIDFIRQIFGTMMDVLDLTEVKLDLEKGVKAVKQSSLNNKFYYSLQEKYSHDSELFRWYAKKGELYGQPKSSFRLETRPAMLDEWAADQRPTIRTSVDNVVQQSVVDINTYNRMLYDTVVLEKPKKVKKVRF